MDPSTSFSFADDTFASQSSGCSNLEDSEVALTDWSLSDPQCTLASWAERANDSQPFDDTSLGEDESWAQHCALNDVDDCTT